MPVVRVPLVVAFFLLLLTACPGRLDDPGLFLDGGGGDGGCNVEAGIFQVTCAGAGCHTPPADNNLDLVSPGVADRLKGTSATCSNRPYTTYLPAKVEMTTPPCGAAMPLGKAMLTTAELACVNAYMAALTDGGQ